MEFEFGTGNLLFVVLFIAASLFLAKNISRLISYIKVAKPDNRFENIGKRIIHTLSVAIFQSKILREKSAGMIHAFIFWGFLILLFAAAQSVFEGLGVIHPFNWLGPVFSTITILTDLFCLFVIIAVIGALMRRFVIKVPRLQHKDNSENFDALFILGMITIIVSSLLVQNAAAVRMEADSSWAVYPIGEILAGIIPVGSAQLIFDICWWLHILFILVFMNYLPYSKHLHVYTSVLNVFFSPVGPSNKLEPIDFEDETAEKFGVVDIEDFSWKTILDGYSCTHCGRCDSVCPANQTGKILSPREIIVQIRNRTMEMAPILVKQQKEKETAAQEGREPRELNYTEQEQEIINKKLIGDYISTAALWQCTSCGACMQECPVNIEHVPAIVGMRRSLVMMEADFPNELQAPFGNFETNSTPWAFSSAERADWAESTGVKTAAENPDFDILFWVGCFGSFDDRAKKISVAFSKLMQKANIDFAILGTEEQCSGDPARRSGNEYLADAMVKMNIETMSRYNVNKIVTTCPHCFNTLKNEYPQYEGNYDVVHHSQFLMQLIKAGRLTLQGEASKLLDVVYHDSCYMGRYNGVYDEPRNVISGIPGLKLKEPDRTKSRGLCCGAGGGQMFMEETEGKRVNIERTEELLDSGANTIAANCPFCMTMLNDGVKAKEKEEDVKVKDIAEILLENVK